MAFGIPVEYIDSCNISCFLFLFDNLIFLGILSVQCNVVIRISASNLVENRVENMLMIFYRHSHLVGRYFLITANVLEYLMNSKHCAILHAYLSLTILRYMFCTCFCEKTQIQKS